MDRFDTELLIDEVEKRPALWDVQCEDYADKIAKNRAWQELIEIFGDGDESFEKNTLLGAMLQKKWKNIRDAYNKEYKKSKTFIPGSGTRKGSRYMYFTRLSFLQSTQIGDPNATLSNLEEHKYAESEDISNEESDFLNSTEIRPPPTKKRKPRSRSEDRLTFFLEKSIKLKDELKKESVADLDADKHFCLSLYSEIKKVPEYRRLATKIELLQVIQKAQNFPASASVNNVQTVPAFLNSQQYPNPQEFIITSVSPSAVIPPESP